MDAGERRGIRGFPPMRQKEGAWMGHGSGFRLESARRVLLLFEDGGVLFVGKNGGLKTAEVGGFGGRNLDLTDDVFALVVEEIAFGRDRGVVAGEVEVEVDGVWSSSTT